MPDRTPSEADERLSALSDEVFQSAGDVFVLDARDIEELKQQASANARGRCRICLHADSAATLQQMVIAIHRDCYFVPHAHCNKTECFQLLEGVIAVLLFTPEGSIDRVIRLSAAGPQPLYRLSARRFHTVIALSETAVYVETTEGPFAPSETEAACWAPGPQDLVAGRAYLHELRKQLERFGEGGSLLSLP